MAEEILKQISKYPMYRMICIWSSRSVYRAYAVVFRLCKEPELAELYEKVADLKQEKPYVPMRLYKTFMEYSSAVYKHRNDIRDPYMMIFRSWYENVGEIPMPSDFPKVLLEERRYLEFYNRAFGLPLPIHYDDETEYDLLNKKLPADEFDEDDRCMCIVCHEVQPMVTAFCKCTTKFMQRMCEKCFERNNNRCYLCQYVILSGAVGPDSEIMQLIGERYGERLECIREEMGKRDQLAEDWETKCLLNDIF